MRVKVYVIELPIPNWVRRIALPIVAVVLVLVGWQAVSRASVPNTFKDGDVLTAQALNDDLKALDERTVPPGTIVAYAGDPTKVPPGWLFCDGAPVDRNTYGALFVAIGTGWGSPNQQQFNLPDLRGRFLRGVSLDIATDPDCATRTASSANGATACSVGTLQQDAFGSHVHGVPSNGAGNAQPSLQGNTGSGSANTGAAGGSETRPKNAAVAYIVKT